MGGEFQVTEGVDHHISVLKEKAHVVIDYKSNARITMDTNVYTYLLLVLAATFTRGGLSRPHQFS